LTARSIRVLLAEDYEPWCRFTRLKLETAPRLQVVGEVSDGLLAVLKAQELLPDLIILDIGLPTLNGIEAARRIRELSPQIKIVFMSLETSIDVVREALATGAQGYVVKMDASNELLTALEAVLRGERYISSRLGGLDFAKDSDTRAPQGASVDTLANPGLRGRSIPEGHVVQFYTDDANLLDSICALFRDTLCAGKSLVALMTRTHRGVIEERLIAQGIDVNEARRNGRLDLVDADHTLSEFMAANGPHRGRFLELLGAKIREAENATLVRRVVVFGEMVAVLWAQKKYDAAIRLEELWNELALTHSFYLCCAYPSSGFRETSNREPYARICAQHSAVVRSL
jgi:CheY-like chemotaxis protein